MCEGRDVGVSEKEERVTMRARGREIGGLREGPVPESPKYEVPGTST